MASFTGDLGDMMNVPEVITKKSRSEGAKKMWERRKAKPMEPILKADTFNKPWVYHAQWLTLMGTIITCFIFCFGESIRVGHRLDEHMEAINRRVDQTSADTNRRCDELHKEFYDLLKEMRREK